MLNFMELNLFAYCWMLVYHLITNITQFKQLNIFRFKKDCKISKCKQRLMCPKGKQLDGNISLLIPIFLPFNYRSNYSRDFACGKVLQSGTKQLNGRSFMTAVTLSKRIFSLLIQFYTKHCSNYKQKIVN